jgi:hypothetical protein
MTDDPIKYGGRFQHSSDVDAYLDQPTRVSKYVSDYLAGPL